MAPPAPPPTGLSSPASVDFASADCPLLLHADEPLVAATPFLQWQAYPPPLPGGPPRVGIPHLRAIKVFLRRCSLDPTQISVGGFAGVDCFTFFCGESSWNRILDQLIQSGMLAGSPFLTWPEFLFHFERLAPQQ